jgi:hypothetical protein
MIVTISSVGYGDIAPKTLPGRFLVIFILFCIIFVLQKQLSDFSKLNNLVSEYSRVKYQKSNKDA